jgi:hypothetical protein
VDGGNDGVDAAVLGGEPGPSTEPQDRLGCAQDEPAVLASQGHSRNHSPFPAQHLPHDRVTPGLQVLESCSPELPFGELGTGPSQVLGESRGASQPPVEFSLGVNLQLFQSGQC